MTEPFDEMIERLQTHLPSARVRLNAFPSGLVMLDVVVNDTLYVIEHVPSEGYGVTLVTPENSFMRGSDAGFATLREAERYLLARLGQEAQSQGAETPAV